MWVSPQNSHLPLTCARLDITNQNQRRISPPGEVAPALL
jgi:hypothetical protein